MLLICEDKLDNRAVTVLLFLHGCWSHISNHQQLIGSTNVLCVRILASGFRFPLGIEAEMWSWCCGFFLFYGVFFIVCFFFLIIFHGNNFFILSLTGVSTKLTFLFFFFLYHQYSNQQRLICAGKKTNLLCLLGRRDRMRGIYHP